jgi:hypothetical protein
MYRETAHQAPLRGAPEIWRPPKSGAIGPGLLGLLGNPALNTTNSMGESPVQRRTDCSLQSRKLVIKHINVVIVSCLMSNYVYCHDNLKRQKMPVYAAFVELQ